MCPTDILKEDDAANAKFMILFDDDEEIKVEEVDDVQINRKPPRFEVKNKWGDDMTNFLWDGPEDSDEEIEELVPFKCEYEKKMGIKYSKNGIIKFVTQQIQTESKNDKTNPKNAKLWEEKLKIPGLTMFLKKGGTEESPDQPFMRTEAQFKKQIKMDKFLNVVSIYSFL